MKCYNHHDRDAFAICKACGKGLCLECVEKTFGAMHCKKDFLCKLKSRVCCCAKFLLLLLLVFVLVVFIASFIGPIH